MKKFIKALVLGLFLLSGVAVTNANEKAGSLLVTNRDCETYLINHGYTNVHVIQILSDGSRVCDTSNSYNTTVVVVADAIVGMIDGGQE